MEKISQSQKLRPPSSDASQEQSAPTQFVAGGERVTRLAEEPPIFSTPPRRAPAIPTAVIYSPGGRPVNSALQNLASRALDAVAKADLSALAAVLEAAKRTDRETYVLGQQSLLDRGRHPYARRLDSELVRLLAHAPCQDIESLLKNHGSALLRSLATAQPLDEAALHQCCALAGPQLATMLRHQDARAMRAAARSDAATQVLLDNLPRDCWLDCLLGSDAEALRNAEDAGNMSVFIRMLSELPPVDVSRLCHVAESALTRAFVSGGSEFRRHAQAILEERQIPVAWMPWRGGDA